MITLDDKRLNRELRKAYKKLERVEQNMTKSDSKDMMKAHKEIGKVYVKAARRNIKPYHKDTVVKKKGKEYPIVRGQLKKSLGMWRPSRKRTTYVAGPRANAPMKQKVRQQADGWFAHFVEQRPKKFGTPDPDYVKARKRAPQNRGVFERTKRQVYKEMKVKQVRLYRQTLKKSVR